MHKVSGSRPGIFPDPDPDDPKRPDPQHCYFFAVVIIDVVIFRLGGLFWMLFSHVEILC